MTSHEFARELQRTVDHMLSRPEASFGDQAPFIYLYFWEKEIFVTAAKAMGPGKKVFQHDDLHFEPNGTCLTLSIPRAKVCRKVQDAKWECEPILSEQEVAELTAPQDEPVESDSIF